MLLRSGFILYNIIKMIKFFLKKGFTLVETLVAIAMMSLLMVAAVSMLTGTAKSEKRNRAITEVEFQASAIMYEITQSIRNASAITSPAVGLTSTSLTLALSAVPAEDPTVFSTSSDLVMVSKAGSTALQLSSNTIQVTSLVFENITATSTKGAVRVFLGIKAANPSSKPELEYATTRVTTVTLR